MADIRFCKSCLAMSTRPRITFNDEGVCNACLWVKQKKRLNWSERKAQLEKLLEVHRARKRPYDVIVPVSGGKDGSYVSHQLKHEYNVNPLCVTVTPPLETDIGRKNLNNFIQSGYEHISLNVNPEILRKVNKAGFKEHGFPYFGWLVAIVTGVVRIAESFDIQLIMYGEDAEMEYGGTSEKSSLITFGLDYMRRIGFEDGYEKVFATLDIPDNQRHMFSFPDPDSFQPRFAHWSYFENWDPYRNYLVAKNNCGLIENTQPNSGTFTNFAQNDQYLYALHTYLMYLKFGFGRANQDACIEIRRGALEREQAINLVNLYDGVYPTEYIDFYLEYYEMKKEEFDQIIDKWANTNLFRKVDNKWTRLFEVK